MQVAALTLSAQAQSALPPMMPAAFPVAQFMAHWWIFPVSIVFAAIALASGVLFFSPFFMLVVKLSPSQAIGAGLLTEVFGMGNGLRAYVNQRVVDFATAKWLLIGVVPAVIGGGGRCWPTLSSRPS